jgi:hypothetical protein
MQRPQCRTLAFSPLSSTAAGAGSVPRFLSRPLRLRGRRHCAGRWNQVCCRAQGGASPTGREPGKPPTANFRQRRISPKRMLVRIPVLAEAASGLGFLNWVSDRGPCPGLNAALTRRLRTRRGRWTSVERWRRYEPWRGEFRDLRSSPDRSVARGAGSVVVKLRTDHSLHAERRASYCIVLGS